MNKCLLCQTNEADKTGSHIIPSFLMKRINGDGKRDHEIGFEISNGVINSYFGRDIIDEKRKTITDKEEKLYSRENLDVEDHIFCKDCEKYFGSLESKYANSLNLHFSDEATTINTLVSPSEALLFWCSVVWRASVTNHFGYRLCPNYEERLRIALESNNIDNLNISYALFRCKDYSKTTSHGTFATMDTKDNAILLIVDDFILVMLFDMEENYEVELFEMKFTLIRDKLNDGKKNEEISPIPSTFFTHITDTLIRLARKSMNLHERFMNIHKILFGEELSRDILNEIIEQILYSGKIGDKYTCEHYVKCYLDVLIKRGIIIKITP